MWPNPQETAALVTFTEEILKRKLDFLCSESCFKAINYFNESLIIDKDHSVSTQTQFSVKLRFLPPDTPMYVCVSGGKKCKLFRKFCVLNRWMVPYLPGFYVSLCWTIFPILQVSITCFSRLLTTQNVHKIQKTYWYSPWSTSKSHVTWRKN